MSYDCDQVVKKHLIVKKYIGVHLLGVRTLARALSSQTAAIEKLDFRWFLKYGRTEARFSRAQPRTRSYGECQWILLAIDILFDYLVAILV